MGAAKDFAAHIDANVDGQCDVCNWYEKSHTHTFFTDVWSRNDEGHWHAASCGHTGVKDQFAAHTPGADGACTVCGYTTHEHSFSDAWTSDATHHWHANTCTSVCDAKDYYLPHTDKDADGVCDICHWYNTAHEHDYATLTYDANGHWYACSQHAGAKKDVADHYDDNNDGACDFCQYADPTHEHTFSGEGGYAYDAMTHWVSADCHSGAKKEGTEAAHSDSANDGLCDICFCQMFGAIVDEVTDAESTEAVKKGTVTENGEENYFEFGKDNYYHQLGLGQEGFEYWYSLYNGELFGVYDAGLGTGISKSYTTDLRSLNGYHVEVYYGIVADAFGASEAIAQLYSLAKTAEDFYCTYNDDGIYTFSASYDYYGSLISFTVTFTIGEYLYYDAEWNEYSLEYVDYCKIEYTDPYGESNTIEFEQVAGVRTAQNAQTADKFMIADFDLTDVDGNLLADGAALELVKGEGMMLGITALTPNGASFDFDALEALVLDPNGEEVYYHINAYVNGDAENGYYVEVSTGWSVVEGVYTVTLKTLNVSYTFKITVKLPPVFYIESQVYSEEYYSYMSTTEVTVYEGMTVQFKGAVNESANNAYTVALTLGNAADVVLEAGVAPYYNSYFTATKTGTYVLTLTSAESTVENPLTCQLTINVVEAPKVSDLLNGKYAYNDIYSGTSIEVTFTPTSEGAENGTAVIVYNGTTYNVDYAYDNGFVNLFDGEASFAEIGIAVTPTFQLEVSYTAWYGQYPMPATGILEAWSPLLAMVGEYRTPYVSMDDPRYTIVLNDDGTGYFAKLGYNPMFMGWAEYYSSDFTWSYEETATAGVYRITFEAGMYSDAPEFDYATVNASCILDTTALEATLTTSIMIDGVATSFVFTYFV